MFSYRTIIFFYFLSILFACSKKNSGHRVPEVLNVELNTNEIYADGLDELWITVRNENGTDITTSSQLYIDNILYSPPVFKTNTEKSFVVKAINNGRESNPVTFTAKRHEQNNFSRKVLIEEFAGMWCGFCTLYTYRLDSLTRNLNNIMPVTIHSGDPLQYVFEPQLRNQYGITSFPAGYVNRGRHWDQTTEMLVNELNRKSKCGIAINSNVNGSIINATIKIKFDITTSEDLKVVVALLEDSLIYPQSNFYNLTPSSPFYQMGDPIINYRHNNTLRKAATDIFGDTIPKLSQQKNNEWSKTYSIDATGINISNSKIVAFIQFAENNATRWGVLNAQLVNAGGLINYD